MNTRTHRDFDIDEIIEVLHFSYAPKYIDNEFTGAVTYRSKRDWFVRVSYENGVIADDLQAIDIVFADPDNGLRDDEKALSGRKGAWKAFH